MESYIRAFFLTCWLDKGTTQEYILERFTRDDLDCKYLVIGAIEETETDKKHFHVVGCLNHSMRLTSLKNKIHSSIHIETLRRAVNAYDYIQKEGCFFNNFTEKVSNDDLYDNICTEILMGLSFKDICQNHPKFAMLHYDNLLKFYQVLTINKSDVL